MTMRYDVAAGEKEYKLTQAGVNELKTELTDLKGRRGDIAKQLKIAREFGDLSENAEYDAVRSEQRQVEVRISEIERILKNSDIIKNNNGSTKVGLGSRVELQPQKGGAKTFHIVGSVEADPLQDKVSDESPIGRALMGKKISERVVIKTPTGETLYTIKKIS